MSRKKKHANFAKRRRAGRSFTPVPHCMLQSKNYAMLSFKAKALLLDLTLQIYHKERDYDTNGNLTCAFKTLQPLGWKSKDTLDAAEAELLHYGFIEVTQQGARRHPTLYAVTWLAVSKIEGKPHIASTSKPSEKYKAPVPKLPPRRPSGKKPIPGDW